MIKPLLTHLLIILLVYGQGPGHAWAATASYKTQIEFVTKFTTRWVEEKYKNESEIGGVFKKFSRFNIFPNGVSNFVADIVYTEVALREGEKFTPDKTMKLVAKGMGFNKPYIKGTAGNVHFYKVFWEKGNRQVYYMLKLHQGKIQMATGQVRRLYDDVVGPETELIMRSLMGQFKGTSKKEVSWVLEAPILPLAYGQSGGAMPVPTVAVNVNVNLGTGIQTPLQQAADAASTAGAGIGAISDTVAGASSTALSEIDSWKIDEFLSETKDTVNTLGDTYNEVGKEVDTLLHSINKLTLEDAATGAGIIAAATAAGAVLGSSVMSAGVGLLADGAKALFLGIKEAITHQKRDTELVEKFIEARSKWDEQLEQVTALENQLDGLGALRDQLLEEDARGNFTSWDDLLRQIDKKIKDSKAKKIKDLTLAEAKMQALSGRFAQTGRQSDYDAFERASACYAHLKSLEEDEGLEALKLIRDKLENRDDLCESADELTESLIEAERNIEELRRQMLVSEGAFLKTLHKTHKQWMKEYKVFLRKQGTQASFYKKEARLGKKAERYLDNVMEPSLYSCAMTIITELKLSNTMENVQKFMWDQCYKKFEQENEVSLVGYRAVIDSYVTTMAARAAEAKVSADQDRLAGLPNMGAFLVDNEYWTEWFDDLKKENSALSFIPRFREMNKRKIYLDQLCKMTESREGMLEVREEVLAEKTQMDELAGLSDEERMSREIEIYRQDSEEAVARIEKREAELRFARDKYAHPTVIRAN